MNLKLFIFRGNYDVGQAVPLTAVLPVQVHDVCHQLLGVILLAYTSSSLKQILQTELPSILVFVPKLLPSLTDLTGASGTSAAEISPLGFLSSSLGMGGRREVEGQVISIL